MIEDRLVQLIREPNTYIGEAPVHVDNCQWLRAASGSPSVFFARGIYDKPTFSIYVRDKNNMEGANRIRRIFNALRNYVDTDGVIIATRFPTFIGKDDKHRSVYSFQIEYQTGGY